MTPRLQAYMTRLETALQAAVELDAKQEHKEAAAALHEALHSGGAREPAEAEDTAADFIVCSELVHTVTLE